MLVHGKQVAFARNVEEIIIYQKMAVGRAKIADIVNADDEARSRR
jgi:hypothetical protein